MKRHAHYSLLLLVGFRGPHSLSTSQRHGVSHNNSALCAALRRAVRVTGRPCESLRHGEERKGTERFRQPKYTRVYLWVAKLRPTRSCLHVFPDLERCRGNPSNNLDEMSHLKFLRFCRPRFSTAFTALSPAGGGKVAGVPHGGMIKVLTLNTADV
ncbi:unnamed protein product [Boreogadus saida]